MLKLVDKHSVEHGIYKSLLPYNSHADPKTFPCVLPPLTILDTPYEYVIVSMPMWVHVSQEMWYVANLFLGGAILPT